MRKIARVDANQKDIVKKLREIPGVSVAITSQLGNGFPDIVVGCRKRNYMIELKDGSKPPSQQKLTPDEIDFHTEWCGNIAVCRNLEEVLKTIAF